jgi:hypothetical protein
MNRRELFQLGLLSGVAATRAYSFLTNNPLAFPFWDVNRMPTLESFSDFLKRSYPKHGISEEVLRRAIAHSRRYLPEPYSLGHEQRYSCDGEQDDHQSAVRRET